MKAYVIAVKDKSILKEAVWFVEMIWDVKPESEFQEELNIARIKELLQQKWNIFIFCPAKMNFLEVFDVFRRLRDECGLGYFTKLFLVTKDRIYDIINLVVSEF